MSKAVDQGCLEIRCGLLRKSSNKFLRLGHRLRIGDAASILIVLMIEAKAVLDEVGDLLPLLKVIHRWCFEVAIQANGDASTMRAGLARLFRVGFAFEGLTAPNARIGHQIFRERHLEGGGHRRGELARRAKCLSTSFFNGVHNDNLPSDDRVRCTPFIIGQGKIVCQRRDQFIGIEKPWTDAVLLGRRTRSVWPRPRREIW